MAIAHRSLDVQVVRRVTRLIDLVLVMLVIAMLVLIALDVIGPARSALAVVVAVLLPGWTLCRWWGWAFSAAMLLTSVATSVALSIIVGQVAVTRTNWPLETVGAVFASVCLILLSVLQVARRAHV